MTKKSHEEDVEEFCKKHGIPYQKMHIERDPVWEFLDGNFSSTPDVLLGKNIFYYHSGGPEVKIYVADNKERKYAMLTVISDRAVEGLVKLQQRKHEAKGLEMAIVNTEPRFPEYTMVSSIEGLSKKQH